MHICKPHKPMLQDGLKWTDKKHIEKKGEPLTLQRIEESPEEAKAPRVCFDKLSIQIQGFLLLASVFLSLLTFRCIASLIQSKIINKKIFVIFAGVSMALEFLSEL